MATTETGNTGSNYESNYEKRRAAKRRLEKVWALYQNPGTEGEKDASWERIQDILPRCTLCKKIGKPESTDVSCGNCSGVLNEICSFIHAESVKKAEEKKKAKKENNPNFIRQWSNGEKRGGMKEYVQQLVNEAKWTRKEIIGLVKLQFPECRSTVPGMYIGHGMNGKGKDAKRFPWKIECNANGKLFFNKEKPCGSWGQV